MMQKRWIFSVLLLMVAVVAFACNSNGMANCIPPSTSIDVGYNPFCWDANSATWSFPDDGAITDSNVYPTTANPATTGQPALNDTVEENSANPSDSEAWVMATGIYFVVPPQSTNHESPPSTQGTLEVTSSNEIASDYDVTYEVTQEANATFTKMTPAAASFAITTNSSGVIEYVDGTPATNSTDLNSAVAMELLDNSTNTTWTTDYPNPIYGMCNVSGQRYESPAMTNRTYYPNPFNETPNGMLENTAVCGEWTRTPRGDQMKVTANDRTIEDIADPNLRLPSAGLFGSRHMKTTDIPSQNLITT